MGEKAGNNKVFKWMSYCEKALYAAGKFVSPAMGCYMECMQATLAAPQNIG
jgi:hypothetical protein